MTLYICSVCQKQFSRSKSTVRNENTVCCSLKCRYEKQKTYVLNKNPNYKHGKFCKQNLVKNKQELYLKLLDDYILKHINNCHSYLEMEQKLTMDNFKVSRLTIAKRIKKLNLSISHFKSGRNRKPPHEEIFCIGDNRRNQLIKNRILQENLIELKCSTCNLEPYWNNLPLVLQLDHINGNPCDNRLENLRFLCPNCHSQTETYTGKNGANKNKKKESFLKT